MTSSTTTTAEKSKPARAWCFTENNPTRKVLFPDGLPEGIRYIVYQLEKGEQETPHLQGYISLARPQRMSWIQKISSKNAEGEIFMVFGRAHLIVAKGNVDQNYAYCTKTEGRIEGPWEIGTRPKGQGERTDLAEAAESLMKDGDIRAVDPAVFLKYASGCLKLAALAPPPRRDGLKVISIIGTTGIGKSYAAHDLYSDLYVVNMGNSGLWWDGYVGQSAVMFEEFKGQVQLQKMLQILDPYPLRLEIKGGLVPARFTTVIITSNYEPALWYKNEDGSRDPELAALYRRLGKGIPPAQDKMAYITASTRQELWNKIKICQTFGVMPGKQAKVPHAAAESVPRSVTPILVDDEEDHCTLKRQKATLSIPDAPADADMVVVDGKPYVRDDILAQWK